MSHPKIAELKNAWLYQQVDVQFPTKESLVGLELYKQAAAECQYQLYQPSEAHETAFSPDELFLVDFHRLTVMFALLQANRWSKPQDQEMIVEFLTQIIYSEPCSLYLGFKEGEAVAAAIVTQVDSTALISDVVCKESTNQALFVDSLVAKLMPNVKQELELFIEK
ncbi:flavodoxin [Vibrio aquaticus]|uniref:Flavodoxin n=1 Tax=Vibrio aquaticus TaxID=2496559 RepID=A0A3S0MQ70_9VIBR|nr:flavodoxin [Vibrio aquaticus]RTZ17406.1 flavodoxin [Vibrio aquaticus]